MPEYPLTPSDVRKTLYWLIEFRLASRDFRFATDRVVITDGDGNDLEFLGGLEVTFSESASMFSPSPSPPSLSINDLHMPVDVAELVERGHPFSGIDVTLSMWVEGEVYERRRVRFTGRLRLGAYGSADQPVSFAVEPNQRGRQRMLPDPGSAITLDNWPDAEDGSVGQIPPIVIGKPGLALANSGTSLASAKATGGTRAYMIDESNDYIVIAAGDVVAGKVTVLNTSTLDYDTGKVVALRTEPSGRKVSTITATGGPPTNSPTYAEGEELWIDWLDTGGTSDGAGGIRNPYGTGALRGAGDVCRWALNEAGASVDSGRWAALADIFNAVKIDTYLDEPTDLARWVQKEILPLLPIFAVLDGPSGVYPVLWRRDFDSTTAKFKIDVARDGLIRTGRVEYDEDEYGNELTIEFAPRADGGDPFRSRTLSGQDVGADDPNIQPNQHLRASNARHGRKPRKTMRSGVIYEVASALRVLAWQSAAYAFPWRFVEYADPDRVWAWLRPGDAGLLTDDGADGASEIRLTDRRCWVHSMSWDDTAPSIRFVLIDQPAFDTRLT